MSNAGDRSEVADKSGGNVESVRQHGDPEVSQNRSDANLQISKGNACSVAPDQVV